MVDRESVRQKTELEGWLVGGEDDDDDDDDDVEINDDVDIPRPKIPGIVVDYC